MRAADGTEYPVRIALVQNGNQLRGTMKGPLGDEALTGKVASSHFCSTGGFPSVLKAPATEPPSVFATHHTIVAPTYGLLNQHDPSALSPWLSPVR